MTPSPERRRSRSADDPAPAAGDAPPPAKRAKPDAEADASGAKGGERSAALDVTPRMLVGWQKYVSVQLPARQSVTAAEPRAVACSPDGVVAVGDDRGESIWLLDSMPDPIGEPAASQVCVLVDSPLPDTTGLDASVRQLYGAHCLAFAALAWGPAVSSTQARGVFPLACHRVDGTVGVLCAARKGTAIETELRLRQLGFGNHVTCIAWRQRAVAAGGHRAALLAGGCLDGSIVGLATGTAGRGTVVFKVPPSDGGPPVALAWLATTHSVRWSHLVSISQNALLQMWAYNAENSSVTFTHTFRTLPFPISCSALCAVSAAGELRLWHAQGTALVCNTLDLESKREGEVVRRETLHTQPITAVAAAGQVVVTSAPDGYVLVHHASAPTEVASLLHLRTRSQSPADDVRGVRICNMKPYMPSALCFLPSKLVLLVMQRGFVRDSSNQKAKNPASLVPLFLHAAEPPAQQLLSVVDATASAVQSLETDETGVGAALCTMLAIQHSCELQGAPTAWYAAARALMGAYLEWVKAHRSLEAIVGVLRLASTALQLVPPFARVEGDDDPTVTPDAMFPATTPSATLSVLRTEIVRCVARRTLHGLLNNPPKDAFKHQEATTIVRMARLLAAIVVRGVAIWVPKLCEVSEPSMEDVSEYQKLKDTSIWPAESAVPAVLKKLHTSLHLMNVELSLIMGVTGVAGDDKPVLERAVAFARRGITRLHDALIAAGDGLQGFTAPECPSSEVAELTGLLGQLKLRLQCQTCSQEVLLDMSRHTLSGMCPSGHCTQLCPHTLLQFKGIHASSKRHVCMACGTVMSYPPGKHCLPSQDPPARYAFLRVPQLSGCLLCGYRTSVTL